MNVMMFTLLYAQMLFGNIIALLSRLHDMI
jgi:hypothetical protein